ncbi:MAG TPA: tetratricopeptide repeat protein [Gemmatimonadaceae bacterium]|nr:tetratricopeptide repeat protein [Gemmatimonadaceae bacterium]
MRSIVILLALTISTSALHGQVTQTDEAQAAFTRGKKALEQNDASKAVEFLEKAVSLNPGSSEYYDWLGKAYGTQAQRAGRLKQALLARKTKSAWEKAIALDPDNVEARQDIILYYLAAPGFMGGSKEKARAQALEIKKRSAFRGALNLASVCAAMKNLTCAETELKSAITNYPDSSAGYRALTELYVSQKQYDRAFATIGMRLLAKPADPVALYSYGRTASISGQNLERGEEALRAYLGAPLTSPPPANAHYRLGLILEKRGDKEGAKREYRSALVLDPYYDEAKKALKAIGGG